jgi:hypothetical protein
MRIPIIICLLGLTVVSNINGQKITKINSCSLARDVYSNFHYINSDSIKNILHSSSSGCSIALIDSLVSKFNREGDDRCLLMLNRIHKFSDGDVSEYLVDAFGKIFDRRFKDLFEFLYLYHRNASPNNLEALLIEYWSTDGSVSNNRKEKVEKLKARARKIVNEPKRINNKIRMAYLNGLLERIDPNFLD